MMHALRRLVLVSCALPFVAGTAAAQVAPTSGHYAGRPSDTGFQGATNVTGGYGAAVPLDLPPARGDLPIPLSLVYTTRGVGAAGAGWDVPLSYLRVDQTVSRRRPMDVPGGFPVGRKQMVLSLAGQTVELVPHANGWAARNGTLALALVPNGNAFTMTDGHGMTYQFTPSIVAGLYLLATVTEPGGNVLTLSYDPETIALPGGASAFTIDLKGITYNITTPTCIKNEIALTYGAAAATPLSLEVINHQILARTHVLQTIDVKARPTCTGTLLTLRQYLLDYAQDGDTLLPRLSAVHVNGADGTPEKLATLPVAKYGYASAVTGRSAGTPALHYVATESVKLPAGPDQGQISSTIFNGQPVVTGWPTHGYGTWQSLTDLNGDGRPDLVYLYQSQLWVAYGQAAAGGVMSFMSGVPLNDNVMKGTSFEMRASSNGHEETETWRMAIDMNGDGRVDIVDATESPKTWVVYLNTPSALSPVLVSWQRRTVDVSAIETLLKQRGYNFPGDFVPLASEKSGHNVLTTRCVKWNPATNVWDDAHQYYTTPQCPVGGPVSTPSDVQRTYTEYELKDVNGDGCPDFVFDVGPVATMAEVPTRSGSGSNDIELVGFSASFQPIAGGEVDAVLNVVGVRLETQTATAAFSSPIVLAVEHPGFDCGVAEWDRSGGAQQTICQLADVNGDGIVDRIESTTAYLGFGDAISGATIALPGDFAEQDNPAPFACDGQPGNHTFVAHHTRGMRDLNGDGIPDYVHDRGLAGWVVQFGTGAGFGDEVTVSPAPSFSAEFERCDGQVSTTTSGLYDIDGDGRPDVVSLSGGYLNVLSLSGSSGIPRGLDSGLLVSVDNGYGGVTHVGYASAKDDIRTLHMVPFPEIVVASLATTGAFGLTPQPAPTTYAYGWASMVFDAMSDRFVMPAYGRSVKLTAADEPQAPVPQQMATITDTSGVAAFDPSLTPTRRFARYLEAGRPSDVTVLAGALGTNAPALLDVSRVSDSRVVAATHQDVQTRYFSEPPITNTAHDDCLEIGNPYDFKASKDADASGAFDACSSHGFIYTSFVDTWRGTAPPPSTANVETQTLVSGVDDFGRTTSERQYGDVHRNDDDVCVDTTYLGSTGILDTPTSRIVWNCFNGTPNFGVVYAKETWTYDSATLGHVTAHDVERHDATTGAYIATVHDFKATYFSWGSLATVTRTRDDGATQTASFDTDPFHIVATHVRISATGAPDLNVYYGRDPYTLLPTVTTDANQTIWGTTYDGFFRQVQKRITPPGGAAGVLAKFAYSAAEGDANGRSVTVTSFPDAVPLANADTAVGRTTTTHFDELGRVTRTEVNLGADYASASLIVGARQYDPLGRVYFEADPFPAGPSYTTQYGTTHYYASDGAPSCVVRATGPAAYPVESIPTTESFPGCVTHSYASNQESVVTQDADSMTKGSAQAGVLHDNAPSALGRPISRSTWQAGIRIEHETLTEDRLGQLTGVTRYFTPSTAADPVTRSWSIDSTGLVTGMTDLQGVPQTRTYDSFGELTSVSWSASGEPVHAVTNRYDGLGRLLHSEETNDGVTDPATVNDYVYDVGQSLSSQVVPTYVLGRLAKSTSPTGAEALSYDAFGGVNAHVYTDEAGAAYVERSSRHGDGSPATVEVALPDHAYAAERVTYAYDSAGRPRSATFTDGSTSQLLYQATSTDALGRVHGASFGGASLIANYGDVGRRLLKDVTVNVTGGARKYIYDSVDGVGRELQRTELFGTGTQGDHTSTDYDALGRVVSSVKWNSLREISAHSFAFDALGNVQSMTDDDSGAMTALGYLAADPDRTCSVGFYAGNAPMPPGHGILTCSFRYDGAGNVISEPTPTGGTRSFTYYNRGGVRTLSNDTGTNATFKYDASGQLRELDLSGGGANDERRDRTYGAHIQRRDQVSGGATTQVFSRRFSAPGMTAIRRGPGGPWLFQFADGHGTRFGTDASGAVTQDVSYDAFGQASSTGAAPGTAGYSSEQWNDGDALRDFGLVHLGARLYDPAIGRFLSRDPLFIPRTAATTNAYAFAMNDPVNMTDRTGLDGPTDAPEPMLPHLGFVLDVVAPNQSTASGQRHVDVTTSAAKPSPTNTARALYWPTVQAVQIQTAADIQVVLGLTADIQTALAVTDIPSGSPLQWLVGEAADVMSAADRALVRPVDDLGAMYGRFADVSVDGGHITRDEALNSASSFQQHLNTSMGVAPIYAAFTFGRAIAEGATRILASGNLIKLKPALMTPLGLERAAKVVAVAERLDKSKVVSVGPRFMQSYALRQVNMGRPVVFVEAYSYGGEFLEDVQPVLRALEERGGPIEGRVLNPELPADWAADHRAPGQPQYGLFYWTFPAPR